MMRLLLILCISVQLAGAGGAPLPPVPRAAAVAAPKTNVFRLRFAWDYPAAWSNSVGTFYLCYGLVPGQWTNIIATGTSNAFTFLKTNWTERTARHFYAVRARTTNGEPSNEVHFPPYPPTHVRVRWKTNAPTTIFVSSTLAVPRWSAIATVTATNEWTTPLQDGQQWYALDRNDPPTITLFNPLN